MTRVFLAAGVAALAITAPANAGPKEDRQAARAERQQAQPGQQAHAQRQQAVRAERPQRAERVQMRAERPARVERQQARTERPARVERQQVRADRPARIERQQARAEHAARVERQQVRAERPARVERQASRQQVREARGPAGADPSGRASANARWPPGAGANDASPIVRSFAASASKVVAIARRPVSSFGRTMWRASSSLLPTALRSSVTDIRHDRASDHHRADVDRRSADHGRDDRRVQPAAADAFSTSIRTRRIIITATATAICTRSTAATI